MRPALFVTSALAAMWAAIPATASAAPLFKLGSLYSIESTQAPSNDATIATLPDPGAQVFTPLTNGLVTQIANQRVVGNATWLTFAYQTVGGIPIGNQGVNWSIFENGITAAQPLTLIAGFVSFDISGTTQAPTNCALFGAAFHVGTDPSGGGGGVGCLAVGTSQQFPAGILPALGTTIDPFNLLDSAGINSAAVTSYYEALEFTAQSVTPAPEPASFTIFGIGVTALASLLLAHRRRT